MKSFLGNFFRHLAIFFWSHWLWSHWQLRGTSPLSNQSQQTNSLPQALNPDKFLSQSILFYFICLWWKLIIKILSITFLSHPIFLNFRHFNTVDSKYNLPMTGFELRISGVGSDRSTKLATTTTAQISVTFYITNGFANRGMKDKV